MSGYVVYPSLEWLDMLVLIGIGAIGSMIYVLFIYLGIVSSDSKIFGFKSKPNITAKWIMAIYIVLGGVVTLLYTVSFEEKSTLFKILLIGFAWPGLILGAFSSKKAHDESEMSSKKAHDAANESEEKEKIMRGLITKLEAFEKWHADELRKRIGKKNSR